MKASVSAIFCGFRSAATALSKVARSGPCADMQLCNECRRARTLGLGVVVAVDEAHEFVHEVAVEERRAEGCSATIQRGGKITKSQLAVPGVSVGEVSTVKIEGSGWSKLTVSIVLNRARSYLYGA